MCCNVVASKIKTVTLSAVETLLEIISFKLNMIKHCLFILIVFCSCSDIKLTSKTGYVPASDTTSKKVYFLTQLDSIPKVSKLIGEFKMRENESGEWFEIHQKLKSFAYKNKANTIKIDEYHMQGGHGTKGHLGYVTGRLFYTNIDSLTTNSQKRDSIYLYVIRYEKDNFVAALSNVELMINDKIMGSIDSPGFYKMAINVGDKLVLSTSKKVSKFDLIIDKKTDVYLKIGKQVRGTSGVDGRANMVSIGDVDFIQLTPLNGRLEFENIIQIKNLK